MARRLLAESGPPIDTWAVAALLESLGVRDLDAREHYGERDIFALARRVHGLALRTPQSDVRADALRSGRGRLPVTRLLARGGFFVVSLLIQFAGLVVLGYSQWVSLDFTLAEASTVAVAAGASFVVTSGFGGALGYLAPFFSEPGRYHLTRRIILINLGLGAGALALGGAALAAVGTYVVSWTEPLLGAGLVYYALFGASALSIGILYSLRRYVPMFATAVLGLACTVLVHEVLGRPIREAQWVGISVSIALALAVGLLSLRRLARRTRGDARFARLPRTWTLARLAAPHFCFAVLYIAFVLADRIVGWSSGDDPLPIWFRTPYELGLDWAMAAVVAGVAFLEITVASFERLLDTIQDRYAAGEMRAHNRTFMRFWLRHLAFALALLLVGVGAAFGGVQALDATGVRAVDEHFSDPVTRHVFVLGAVGYVCLGLGLGNCIFLFSLARPWLVVAAIVAAFAVNLAVGIPLSREWAYWWSAAGVAAGGFVFALATGVAAWRTLRRADLYLYAAY